jgi:phage baseplate assembly protein W
LADEMTASLIKDDIERAIKRWEPRVSALSVRVSNNIDRNAYNITLYFQVTYGGTVEFTFILNRTR